MAMSLFRLGKTFGRACNRDVEIGIFSIPILIRPGFAPTVNNNTYPARIPYGPDVTTTRTLMVTRVGAA